MSAIFTPLHHCSHFFSWRLLLITFLLFSQSGFAAYVQNKDCLPHLVSSGETLSSHPTFTPESTTVYLEHQHNETHLILYFSGVYPDLATCDKSNNQNVSVGLKMASLGGSSSYTGELINSTCHDVAMTNETTEYHLQIYHFLFKISRPTALAAFSFNVDIHGSDDLPVGCIDAFLTFEISSAVSEVSFWGPVSIILVVLLAAGLREWSNLKQSVDDDEEQCTEQTSTSRAHLTRIADCLSYIQFIFFAGALSLNYPGFFQPVASASSWSVLMLQNGIVTKDSWYYGVKDGIYEVNGTFGGTAGLELMAQVIGAPVTMMTFANIITLAVVILIGLFFIVQLGLQLDWTRDWLRRSGGYTPESFAVEKRKAVFWIGLRVFFSYLLLPLTAWTTYQLGNAGLLPAYYTFLAITIVTLLVALCWWAMTLRTPHNMGYLLIDEIKKEQPGPHLSKSQNVATLATFVLFFVRGTAIGALQNYETAQITVLIMCEVGHVGLGAWVWSLPGLLTRSTLVSGVRCCILLLCIGMLPNVASYQAASALGYVILVLHTVVLVSVFLIPALYELARFSMAGINKETKAADTKPAHQEERPQVCLAPFHLSV